MGGKSESGTELPPEIEGTKIIKIRTRDIRITGYSPRSGGFSFQLEEGWRELDTSKGMEVIGFRWRIPGQIDVLCLRCEVHFFAETPKLQISCPMCGQTKKLYEMRWMNNEERSEAFGPC